MKLKEGERSEKEDGAWVRPWTRKEKRQAQGFANNLVMELRCTDTESFQNFFRLGYFFVCWKMKTI